MKSVVKPLPVFLKAAALRLHLVAVQPLLRSLLFLLGIVEQLFGIVLAHLLVVVLGLLLLLVFLLILLVVLFLIVLLLFFLLLLIILVILLLLLLLTLAKHEVVARLVV